VQGDAEAGQPQLRYLAKVRGGGSGIEEKKRAIVIVTIDSNLFLNWLLSGDRVGIVERDKERFRPETEWLGFKLIRATRILRKRL